jgi:hypothetical protein
MKRRVFLFLAPILLFCSISQAQDRDIFLGYDDLTNPGAFVLDPEGCIATTGDGILLVCSDMEQRDPFTPGDYSSDLPGFSNLPSAGLMFNPENLITIKALDARTISNFAEGYVNYYNPSTDALEASGRILFRDNTPFGFANTPDLVLNGDVIESGSNPQMIAQANSNGFVHDHILWDLLDDASAPAGAYGIMVQLESDYTADGTVDLLSEPFWLVFNHLMSEDDFLNLALPKYGVGQVVSALLGDVNLDGVVDFGDIPSFIAVLSSGQFQVEADCDENGMVDFDDIPAFIAILINA